MNQKQIEYFMAVYRCRNVQRAADRLYVSRQGVSKMIRSLEEELGEALFTRTPQGLVPTAYADALLPHVRRIADEYAAIAGMRSLTAKAHTVVSVQAMDHVFGRLGAAFLRDFHDAYPDITLSVVDTTDEAALAALAGGQCDFAVIPGRADESKFVSERLFFAAYAVRVRHTDPLAKLAQVTYKDLDGRLITGKGRAYACFRQHMDNYVLLAGYRVDLLAEVGDERLLTELVALTGAVAIGYDYGAALYTSPEVAVVPFGSDGDRGQDICLVRRIHGPLTSAAQRFRDFLLQWLAAHDVTGGA